MSITPVKVHDLIAERADARGSIILVDRLWPRGVAKKDLALDAWLADVAPSPDLRRWFGHQPERFEEFARRYREELGEPNPAVEKLLSFARQGDLTLLYAARDRDCNHAVVLAQWLAHEVSRG